MNFYVLRMGTDKNSDIINKVIKMNKNIEMYELNNYYNKSTEPEKDDICFIYFGGDSKDGISWTRGLRAVCQVTRKPYDIEPRGNRTYYKIKVKVLHALKKSIPEKDSKLHEELRYRLWDIPYIGAKNAPNQAIGIIKSEDSVKAAIALYNEYAQMKNFASSDLTKIPELTEVFN